MSIRAKENKITEEDKDLIRETVNSVLALRNSGALNGDDDGNLDRLREDEKSNAIVWRTLAFVMFGILILFASDVIEFKKFGGQSNSNSNSNNNHDIIGGIVEKKVVHVSTPVANLEHDPVPSPVSVNPPEKIPTATSTVETNSDAAATNQVQEVNLVTTAKWHTYKTRGQPMSDNDRKEMEDKWGTWTLNADTKDRPTDDYYAAYPNRDVPRSKFPSNAWQTDKEWLSKFLPESIKLVDRAMNAILEEYGQPLDGTSDLFSFEKYDQWNEKMDKEPCQKQIGCTLVQSFENLKRRLLHAIMTEDIFVVAMGGHSSSAGHGNHFTQSYTLQVQWILEAVFSRLGVRHQSRNIGLGGLGTTQTGVATKQILGHDVDVLMWDSGALTV